jgi:Pretoxin HINT domain
LNLYAYVYNNPLIHLDPTGNFVYPISPSLTCAVDMGNCKSNLDAQVKGGKAVAKNGADFLLLDDINTMLDPNSSLGDKGLVLLGFFPPAKFIKTGTKISKATAKVLAKCNCFTAGTKVLTDEGEKNIEDIEVGDKVLAKDEETGEQAYKEVVALHRNEKDTTYKLSVGNQLIETTNNHPFWVEGKGWVLAIDLKVGDELVQSNGNHLKIENIEIVHHDEKVKVYNFTVADFHTYFVSSLGIWVHNINCGFTLSGNNIQHIGKHIASDFANQVPHLSDKALAAKLNKNSFFNASWTKEDIITGVQNGANEAISKGFTNGYYNYSYKGETIQIFFKDGKFDTAFGQHKLTPADFGR